MPRRSLLPHCQPAQGRARREREAGGIEASMRAQRAAAEEAVRDLAWNADRILARWGGK